MMLVWPLQAMLAGKVGGYEVERSPLVWLPVWLGAIVLLPLVLILWPLYVLTVLAGGGLMLLFGRDARVTDQGVEIVVRRRVVSRHAWHEIDRMAVRFNGPGFQPELTLTSGTVIPLELASVDTIRQACDAHGIAVDDAHAFDS